ncbi:hypothetical protein Ancab_032129 [Ancistrocladus abbreviatus]
MATEKSVMAVIRASRPCFRNNHDKVAFAVHASFLASGFVLVATGPPAFAESALSSSSTEEVGIENWNEVEDEYAFVYVNTEKGNKKVLVKCLAMGDKLVVDALSDGASEPVHVELNVDDYIEENAGNNYNEQYKNLGKLVSSLDSNVLSKLDAPSARSSTAGASSSRRSENPSRDTEEQDVDRELEGVPDLRSRVAFPPIGPIGSGDLVPGPGAGMYPPRGDFGDGSMLLGPDDPRWFGGRSGQPGFPGGLGVPPGARFDPYGPPGIPGFEPGRFARIPRRPGRGTHPDLEQPGAGNGYDYI